MKEKEYFTEQIWKNFSKRSAARKRVAEKRSGSPTPVRQSDLDYWASLNAGTQVKVSDLKKK